MTGTRANSLHNKKIERTNRKKKTIRIFKINVKDAGAEGRDKARENIRNSKFSFYFAMARNESKQRTRKEESSNVLYKNATFVDIGKTITTARMKKNATDKLLLTVRPGFGLDVE